MQDPLEYLLGLKSTDIRLGLGPFTRLVQRLENPHEEYPTVLIGGTNGKGSVAAMLSSVCICEGLRTGLYTSPHLSDVRERLRINGNMISSSQLYSLIDEVRREVREEVTYFEFLTALAFLYFFREKVDIALLEVGLGGRLDATNIVTPIVSVITNVSRDHRQYLGNRIEAIAREKGGIIKDGIPCVTGAKQKRVREILESLCRGKGSTLYRLGKDIQVRRHADGTFTWSGMGKRYAHLTCSLVGAHQVDNAALAIGVVQLLTSRGITFREESIREGLKKAHWEGRIEVLNRDPIVLVDGAHNAAGAFVLSKTLKEAFSYRRLILIFGVLGDKDYGMMLRWLAPLADYLIITKPDTPRGMHPAHVASVAKRYRKHIISYEKAYDALRHALSLAERDDLICITGSLYLVGEIKRMYAEFRTESLFK